MTALVHTRVRLYDQVRTAHLERARALEPATIVYRRRRYDFDQEQARGLDLVQAGAAKSVALAMSGRWTELEVNEPLDLASLPRTAAVLAATRVGRLLGRRAPAVVTYAIGNLDVFDVRAPRLRSRLRRRAELALARYVWRRVDRVAFGTPGARDVYARRFPAAKDATLIPALPSACDCAASPRDGSRVLFVGSLSERKGLPQLLAAWPAVRTARPDATLVIVGMGPLEDDVRRAAAADPSIRLLVDPPRADIHRELRAARTLVLPSQPRPLWREQIGLPIVEALAHGCRIVTSSETGLAAWLTENGHTVLAPHAAPAEWGTALAHSLTSQQDAVADAQRILSTLPHEDGRLAADRWLFQPKGATA
ncbi:glycosyltransferase family 4 protein [Leifsonia sp. fls2-241-R2A-40a]|uniref:glycosyltransferase family 4 protein n=1 Tax=Leifsonia sp. fls2-241-R2A-40a TaxID=3040290 RepID=UPI002549FE38|nr:glycosyltransferase family 4 protein [Leifsonia sp. fls2-241-R2A-40a]